MSTDDYKISTPANLALFGFGDAVCVIVVKWIAESDLNPVVNELIRGRAAVRITTTYGRFHGKYQRTKK